jgi:CheY-like chemotaxis protein
MRVLAVDDDADFALLLRRALEVRGHIVEVVNSAFGLVNRAAGSAGLIRPDVVVLDCGLPGLSGVSALELLSRDRRTSDLPVVLVSASIAGPEQIATGLEAHGKAIFIPKDGHFRQLAERVEEHAAAWLPAVVRS